MRWAEALCWISRYQLEAKRFTQAETLLRECLTLREETLPGHWALFETQVLLGAALLGQQKHAEAEPLLTAGYAGLHQEDADIPPVGPPSPGIPPPGASRNGRLARLTFALEQLVALYGERKSEGDAERLAEYQKLLDAVRANADGDSAVESK